MEQRSRELLSDIRRSCGLIVAFTDNGELSMTVADEKSKSAVERQFEIIGEALARLERGDSETAHRITDVRRIIGFRNQIAHGYDRILDENIDEVIRRFLPILVREVEVLLTENA